MKKLAALVITLIYALGLAGCGGNIGGEPETAEPDGGAVIPGYDNNERSSGSGWYGDLPRAMFRVSLTWGVYGQSSYDGKTGRLVKTTQTSTPEAYVTELRFSDTVLAELYRMVMEMDIPSYPDVYDPYNHPAGEVKLAGSKPPFELILTVQTAVFEKTIQCDPVLFFGEGRGYDRKSQAFLDLCQRIYTLIVSSEEWKALPAYEVLYE